MKKIDVEKYLNKNVIVQTVNFGIYRGILYKSDDEKYAKEIVKKGYYFCENEEQQITLFKSSHVKKIEEVTE